MEQRSGRAIEGHLDALKVGRGKSGGLVRLAQSIREDGNDGAGSRRPRRTERSIADQRVDTGEGQGDRVSAAHASNGDHDRLCPLEAVWDLESDDVESGVPTANP